MSKQFTVLLPQQLEEKLTGASERTGLSKSEITRRGLIREVKSLETDGN
jgi:predicted DNA-binding protein